ncbi:MAG: CpaF family protein [Deltaproteobacteria bacterium]|jgi:pilus assembly protein CpaF|nr:CpaF family protein [Deltaproteobacteria bacterium]MBW2500470.1 CpaF family protein [Deltaproteobacteria bacterium]
MALLERLSRKQLTEASPEETAPAPTPEPDPRVSRADSGDGARQELKFRVHNALFDMLDLGKLSSVSPERASKDVAAATRRILDEQRVLLSMEDRDHLVQEIQNEVFGLGPLEPLLQDPTVTDILVNGHDLVYVERFGKLEKTAARFKDDAHVMRIIERIVSAVGRRIDETNPMVDARLADGSRVNAIIPPLALDGPSVSIRRFGADPLGVDDLVKVGAITPEIVELLNGIVKARLNVLISGGTGAGKTTLLNVVSSFIPSDERIVTIEDSAELQLKQDHVVRLETRPANIEGKGRIAQRDLLINSLRMRPDRIVVGEVRGPEALDMLQAMNTGHDGSLTTVHANSPRDALSRVETMVAMGGLEIPARAVRNQIASAINVVVQLSRLSDGRRRLVSLQEVTGMEGDVVTMQEIFTFDRRGVDEDGMVIGEIAATGLRPRFSEKVRLAGIDLPGNLFDRKTR